MLSRFTLFKYALIVAAIALAIGLWVMFRRVTQQSFFRAFKLSSGYASALITENGSVLIGAGESFEIVRVVGDMLPLFHNQIDYLIVPSRRDDLPGVLDVMKRFKVNTLIMLPVATSSATLAVTTTATSSELTVMNKVTERDIYSLAGDLKIPILYVSTSTSFDFGEIQTDIVPMFSHGKISAQYLGIVINNQTAEGSRETSKQIIIIGKSTKAQSRDLLKFQSVQSRRTVLSQEMHVVTYQTLSMDNIDTELLRQLKPSTIVVSDYIRPKKTPQSTKSKKTSTLNINTERLIAEQGTTVGSLAVRPFRLDVGTRVFTKALR